jgi:2-dehydro-3-deoxy-D-arabinonate dehydratase
MKLYRTPDGIILLASGKAFLVEQTWDSLLSHDSLSAALGRHLARTQPLPKVPDLSTLLPPIGSQEVWAAGVTYYSSREARMEEAQAAGGSDFYDRVYHADRPELFFKASARRVVGPGGRLRLRRDSSWVVPEPELTLALGATGAVVGYTIGNDLSCRDIEAENPLYLPQAKVFDACAGLGPCVLVSDQPLPAETPIILDVQRHGESVFSGATNLAQIKRSFAELGAWLFAETSFPNGCYLMTGTGIVPPDDFSLESGDTVRITIAPIGTLQNEVCLF